MGNQCVKYYYNFNQALHLEMYRAFCTLSLLAGMILCPLSTRKSTPNHYYNQPKCYISMRIVEYMEIFSCDMTRFSDMRCNECEVMKHYASSTKKMDISIQFLCFYRFENIGSLFVNECVSPS
ncbi:unnamed protein product [Albugo candida]|uniref:Uncharacterized protein n=1 Tax=Albugo candida TaxID=65357 RepID=A0A024GQ40_9STRA|nr:unnamed protein product [Albugo candida]|eukprot:CCI48994.1 unnamed protein product [Albugo candida]